MNYQGMLEVWKAGWPFGWIHCQHTIGPTPRIMKNLAAFRPGSLVFLTLGMPEFLAAEHLAADVAATVKLLHLVSYEHMGVVRASCVDGCTCTPYEIDGHLTRSGRNVSVYVEATMDVRFSPASSRRRAMTTHDLRRCVISLRVLKRTSSGEHRWVLTRATVGTPMPADASKKREASRGATP